MREDGFRPLPFERVEIAPIEIKREPIQLSPLEEAWLLLNKALSSYLQHAFRASAPNYLADFRDETIMGELFDIGTKYQEIERLIKTNRILDAPIIADICRDVPDEMSESLRNFLTRYADECRGAELSIRNPRTADDYFYSVVGRKPAGLIWQSRVLNSIQIQFNDPEDELDYFNAVVGVESEYQSSGLVHTNIDKQSFIAIRKQELDPIVVAHETQHVVNNSLLMPKPKETDYVTKENFVEAALGYLLDCYKNEVIAYITGALSESDDERYGFVSLALLQDFSSGATYNYLSNEAVIAQLRIEYEGEFEYGFDTVFQKIEESWRQSVVEINRSIVKIFESADTQEDDQDEGDFFITDSPEIRAVLDILKLMPATQWPGILRRLDRYSDYYIEHLNDELGLYEFQENSKQQILQRVGAILEKEGMRFFDLDNKDDLNNLLPSARSAANHLLDQLEDINDIDVSEAYEELHDRAPWDENCESSAHRAAIYLQVWNYFSGYYRDIVPEILDLQRRLNQELSIGAAAA